MRFQCVLNKGIFMYGIVFLILMFGSISAHSQTVLRVDWSQQTELTYKRGYASPGMGGFFDSVKMREYLQHLSASDVTIFNGIRNLYKDPATKEFYQEDGIYKNRQLDKFTTIRKYAQSVGLEMISQVGGTPQNSGYRFDTTFRKRPDPNFYEPDVDFAPLPAEGESMQAFQHNFAQWAINADKAVGENYHSIWIGTQEIAHTIGFRDGVLNTATKKESIRRYVDYWKPISDTLRSAGARTGGIQLNSSNADLYNYAVDYMIEKNMQLDFLTFQFYQWGDTAALMKAVDATKRYRAVFPETKLIIDRGGNEKILPDGVSSNTSRGVLYYLVGELAVMNNAEYVYAYTLDRRVETTDSLNHATRSWIYRAGSTRLGLSGMPDNVNGFALKTDKKLSVLLWNRTGSSSQQLNLKMANTSFPKGAVLSAKRVSGSNVKKASVLWNEKTNTIENVHLNPYDYVMIELEFAEAKNVSGALASSL